MYLGCLFLFPLLGVVHLAITPKWARQRLERVALFWSLLTLCGFCVLVFMVPVGPQFYFAHTWEWLPSVHTTLHWGSLLFAVDGLSLFLIGLSILLTPICVLMSWKAIPFMKKEFFLCLYSILLLLLGVFTVLDILGFYILFEGILIPMFILIGVWGSREEKVRAAFYFFFYTLVGSLLMLLSIFKLYSIYGTTHYLTLITCELPAHLQFWLLLGFSASLAAKIPMLPVHIWLPQAHVEAPVAGSVLLAGILLKLGGYGFIRFAFPLFPLASDFIAPGVILLSLLAAIYASLTTCRQTDVKRLIAYSSVAHMGLVTLAIFTHSIEGLVASVVMMLAHGLVSSGLFMTAAVLYVRHHTRTIRYFRGVTVAMPLFSGFTLVLILANVGFPLTFNFIAELFSILAAFNYSPWVGVLSCGGALLSVVYALYYYNRVYFGHLSPHLRWTRDMDAYEFQSHLPLIVLTLALGVVPTMVINLLNAGAYHNISL